MDIVFLPIAELVRKQSLQW